MTITSMVKVSTASWNLKSKCNARATKPSPITAASKCICINRTHMSTVKKSFAFCYLQIVIVLKKKMAHKISIKMNSIQNLFCNF